MKRSGFTLVELILSITILTIIVSITMVSFLHFTKKRTELEVEQFLYENARFTMEKIVKEVREGTIDFEEYFNRAMTEGGEFTWYGNRDMSTGPISSGTSSLVENNFYHCSSFEPLSPNQIVLDDWERVFYYPFGSGKAVFDCIQSRRSDASGANHQLYGQLKRLFWDYGAPDLQQSNSNYQFSIFDNEDLGRMIFSEAPITGEEDIPFLVLPQWIAHSEADFVLGSINDVGIFESTAFEHSTQNELYLIDPETNRRTILRLRENNTCIRESGGSNICPDAQDTSLNDFQEDDIQDANTQWIPQQDGAIEKLELIGYDYGLDHRAEFNELSSEYDGKLDTWVCDPSYDCTGGIPTGDNKNPYYDASGTPTTFIPTTADMGFIPITPPEISIKKLTFTIIPVNDPKLSWSEDHPLIQNHPQVRIVMTAIPGYDQRRRIAPRVPEITLSTTVSIRLY